MATRIEEILTRARDTLSDPLQERWTDARLIRLIDEAQNTLALKAGLLRSSASIPLAQGVSTYKLPPTNSTGVVVLNNAGQAVEVISNGLVYSLPQNIHIITRGVNNLGDPIKILSHAQADKLFGTNWEAATGPTVKALIFDKMDQNVLKLYPIPDDSVQGDVTSELATLNSLYGVTVAGGLESTYDLMAGVYGVFTGLTQITNTSITIFYIRIPAQITSVTDSLEVNPLFDKTLKLYVTGMALRDDKDTQNRSLGNEELALFNSDLQDAKKASEIDFTASGIEEQFTVPYGRAI